MQAAVDRAWRRFRGPPRRRAVHRVPRAPGRGPGPLRDRGRRHLGSDGHGRRRHDRVHHHERGQAVRAGPRLRRAGARPSTGHGGRERHRPAVQRGSGRRGVGSGPDQPDGEPRRDRHDQPGARRVPRGAVGADPGRAGTLRRAGGAGRDGDRLDVRDVRRLAALRGRPAKSGIGGGIISVAAGKGCLATFAPPLDAAGNSVRGRLVARYLARALGLDMLASAPDPTHTGPVS